MSVNKLIRISGISAAASPGFRLGGGHFRGSASYGVPGGGGSPGRQRKFENLQKNS